MNSHDLSRRSFLMSGAAAAAAAVFPSGLAESAQLRSLFVPAPLQYIAALGDPHATSGVNAHTWGLWRLDPGPRGVPLWRYDKLKAKGVAPAGWTFDATDWWLEEHGLIMEAPSFPIPAGHYQVTGDREKEAVLTVHPAEKDGTQRWSLDSGATIYDVTHLGCRSARYTNPAGATSCSPASARQSSFPVRPGAAMPPVANCHKQDYAVLIVTGMADKH